MSRLQTFTRKVISAYENFDFHEVFHDIYNFCIVDMSSFYLDVLKDRLYTFRSDSIQRRAAQWVLYQILSTMTRLMAPILSFTAEEVWQSIRQSAKSKEHDAQTIDGSVFLTTFPEVDERYVDGELEKRWNDLFLLRNEVNKALEVKRAEKFIGNSLEAKVILYLPDKYNALITAYKDLLPSFFIVSAVEITNTVIEDSYKSVEVQGLEITVGRAAGTKCQRCWNWSELVGTFTEAPEICERCYKVISE